MKHYIEIEVPARKSKQHDKTTCDLCGNKIKIQQVTEADSA